jgi:hypothetical protein
MDWIEGLELPTGEKVRVLAALFGLRIAWIVITPDFPMPVDGKAMRVAT